MLVKRFRGLVGSPIGSDLSFVFHKKQRFFAHKVRILSFPKPWCCHSSRRCFCSMAPPTFRKSSNPIRRRSIWRSRKSCRYAGYCFLPPLGQNLDPPALAMFLKLVYTSYTVPPSTSSDLGTLLNLVLPPLCPLRVVTSPVSLAGHSVR